MKKIAIILFTISLVGLVGTVVAGPVEDGIAARIMKAGSVCVEGADCAANTVMASSGGGGGADAASNYNKTCATCHAIGIAGAPKFGDSAAWESRLEKGMDILYQSAVNGMPPGMPAKGMCFTCSDDDLKAIVDYMVEAVK